MTTRRIVPIVAAIVIVAAAALAIILSSNGTLDPGGSSSAPPVASASAPSGGAAVIDGTPLPPFTSPTNDVAVGQPIPSVTATTMDGQPITIGPGKPTILLFLAHWCSHCQAEVPVVQAWIDAGGLPAELDLIAVSTSLDPAAPNYPPSDWLEAEAWTAPTIEDGDQSIAAAFGLPAFPYWVITDAQGTVEIRLTGELTVEQLDTLVDILTEG